MENASKALIIVGAILIALLLITMGRAVLNMFEEPKDEAAGLLTSEQVESFNSNFTALQGSSQRANEVIQLMTKVQSNNRTDSTKQISVVYGSLTDPAEIAAEVEVAKKYKVVVKDSDSNGYVDQITITEN